MATPETKIYVCSGVRLSSRNDHSIYFETEGAQLSYFMGKAVKPFTAYSYIRKSWSLKLNATLEEANSWNYLFFQNTPGGKWWYYFINSIEYVNDGTVELSLELDVLQTYLFEYKDHFLPCFIERQHTDSDEVGEHTVLENLELGDYTIQGASDVLALYANMCVLIQATKKPQTVNMTFGGELDDVYSGLGVYAVERKDWGGLTDILNLMSTEWADIDAIVNMWMYPQALISLKNGYTWGDDNVIKDVKGVEKYSCSFPKKIAVLDGHTPDNNKLLCYPFSFMYVTNNSGGSAVYKYERFTGDKCQFHVEGTVSPDACASLIPENYNGVEYNYDESLTIAGFPTCAWNADMYKIWLAQNQNTHRVAMQQANISFLVGAGTAVGSLAVGNVAGAVAGGLGAYGSFTQVQNLMAAKMDKSLEPPQARGQHSSSVNYSNDAHTFFIYNKCINKEHAKMIDDYFTVYGYQVNKVDIPKLNNRTTFTFTKTQGCLIDASICNEDMNKIKQIFDNGVTFWKDGDLIGDYSLSNRPIKGGA